MANKLFANVENMVAEIEEMKRDDLPKNEDRATVSAFFNGRAPYSQEECDALGLTVNVNNLFGYEHLATSRDQLLALYTTPPRLWEITMDRAPLSHKTAWEAKATSEWNRIMKQSGRLKSHYEFAAGDCTMHGEGMLWFPSLTDWCPKHCSLARRLIPAGASLDKRELTHFAILSYMPLRDVKAMAENPKEGWKGDNLSAIVERTFRTNSDKFTTPAGYRGPLDESLSNPELLEYYRQASGGVDRIFQTNIPVAYFFQVNFDHPTRPFDCTVIAPNALPKSDGDMSKKAGHVVLFEQECFYPTIDQAIFPLHMNCAIGGEALWHRVVGLGHLNYQLSWHLEVLINRAIQAAHEQSTTFFQAADSASREAMEQILIKHNGIIPEGISMVQNRVGSDFSGLLSIVQLVRQQGASNANQISPNNGSNADLKEVQAIFQQNMVGTNATNRVSNWFDYMGRLGHVILSRFTNRLIQPWDAGYSEIMEFQAAMVRHGVPLDLLQPENVRVAASRVPGDGIKQKAVAGQMALMDKLAQFGPEAQMTIKRDFVGVMTDNYEYAEKLVPYSEAPDHYQVLAAETENNVFAVQGKPMATNDSDVDSVHIQCHFDFLASLVKKGVQLQKSAFTPEQAMAFKACGAHVIVHIRALGNVDKDAGAAAMDQLGQIAAIADKLLHNMQQMQQGQEKEPLSAADQAKLQLEAQKLHLAQQKAQFNEEKFDRTQALREHEAAGERLLKLERDSREKKKTDQDLALRDVETAASLQPTEAA